MALLFFSIAVKSTLKKIIIFGFKTYLVGVQYWASINDQWFAFEKGYKQLLFHLFAIPLMFLSTQVVPNLQRGFAKNNFFF